MTVTVIKTAEEAIAAAQALAAEWSNHAAERDRAARIPRLELDSLRRSGLLGISVPREYGGAGVSYRTVVAVFRLLGRADGSLAQVPQNHFDFVDVLASAPEVTKSFFYAQVLKGARFGNALAEKGRRGGDIGTGLTVVPGGYLLTGEKSYATGALTADWVPVSCRHPNGRTVVAYVDRKAPGLVIDEDWNAFGQRLTFSGSVHLQDVFVPEDRVIDRLAVDPLQAVVLGAGNQAIHAAIEVGIAEGALDAVLGTAALQSPGVTQPLEPQLPGQRPPVMLAAELAVAWALVDFAGSLVAAALSGATAADRAVAAYLATEEAKSVAYEVAPRVTAEAIGFLGAAGASAALGLDRFWRNSRTHSLHDPARWRRYYVGDYFLNGRLPQSVKSRLVDNPAYGDQNA